MPKNEDSRNREWSPKNSGALWTGRFSAETSRKVQEFTRSIHIDRRLARYDLEGSRAHVHMLADRGILSGEDRDRILDGLATIETEIESGAFLFRDELEDIHMNIEARLQELKGEAGKRIHTARSRNDQVALDLKLFCRDEARKWRTLLVDVQRVLVQRVDELKDMLFAGWTHLQSAQPVSWGHYLLAFAEMFGRDHSRLVSWESLHSVSPLGAGALAGSTLELDPEATAGRLGFRDSFRNSYDVVGDRDAVLELLQIATQIMIHLSRLAEDFIYFSSTPVGWIELPDELCTGSSMMPQKKNPDVLELIRGRCASVIGHSTGLTTLLKGLPTSYHRDLQQDKEHLFAVSDFTRQSLEILPSLLLGFKLVQDRADEALKHGFLMATDLAEYLVQKGTPFREAHRKVGNLVGECVRTNRSLDQMKLEEIQAIAPECDASVSEVLDPHRTLQRRRHKGATGSNSINLQLDFWRDWLKRRKVHE